MVEKGLTSRTNLAAIHQGRDIQRYGTYQGQPVHAAIEDTEARGRPRSNHVGHDNYSCLVGHISSSGYFSQDSGPHGYYACDEFVHLAKDYPRHAPTSLSLGTQMAQCTPALAVRGVSQSARGGTMGVRGGA